MSEQPSSPLLDENDEKKAAPMAEESHGGSIPMWVALAGMLLAFILAILIMVNIGRPLLNLIFPPAHKVPLPDGADVMEELDNPSISDTEILYGLNGMDACQVAQFFQEQGATCIATPRSCINDEEGNIMTAPNSRNGQPVATCTLREQEVAASFSWEVIVSVGNRPTHPESEADLEGTYQTIFRMYTWSER